MKRDRLTPDRIRVFTCPLDSKQAFYWDTVAPRLAVRATASAKSFIFEAKLNRRTIRTTIPAESSGSFELPPPGPTAARCCALIDLGSQESTFEGRTSLKRKILLTWELAELRSDDSPFKVSRRFGLSLHENAALRAFMQAWRGRPFTDEELAGFDLARLAGAPCLLNLAHVNRAGKDYSNNRRRCPDHRAGTA